jgi:hypothetical protein
MQTKEKNIIEMKETKKETKKEPKKKKNEEKKCAIGQSENIVFSISLF